MNFEKQTISAGWNLENTYGELPKVFFSSIKPTPVTAPQMVILNRSLAASLGLDSQALEREDGIAIFAGNEMPPKGEPLAQAYAGHQFGHFTMLGDGRAILIGEQITPTGERMDIQLKGAGRTPYSRGGDGRASLGPMLREYIISEAMHSLGIGTTRSLAVVATGESVRREKTLPGAILTRIATSHIRVGTFQYGAQWCTIEELRALADYTLGRHYSDFIEGKNPYLSLLEQVIKAQAILIAKWQLVGFIHGVMNTDNTAINGETIDYGPCAFMEAYDPQTVFSSIDTYGRYAYGNQPTIAAWNLARFAETLLPLLHSQKEEAVSIAQDAVSKFSQIYHSKWLGGMGAKLGLFNEEEGDEELIKELLNMMEKHRADFINTFRGLTLGQDKDITLFASPEFAQWYNLWQGRLARQKESKADSEQLMKNNNPAIIPRNHRVEEALNKAVEHGDYTVMDELLDVLSDPYAYSPQQANFISPAKDNCNYRTFCGT